MADNVPITPGVGADIAADDIGGVFFQRIKAVFGSDGVATDVTENTPLPVNDSGTVNVLQRIFNLLTSPMGYDKSIQRQRVAAILESGTVTTVTTVTTLANIDGYNARMQILDQNRTSWAQCVRARIT
jgi:NADPH:quinone reductase-like Zn-dependent oxidoreductase